MKRLWFLLFVPILMVACETTTEESDYEAIFSETLTWSAAGINVVAVSTENGNISASAAAGDNIAALITRSCTSFSQEDAEAYLDCVVVMETIAEDTLMMAAEMPGGGDRSYYADFDLTAPASIYPMLSSVNGVVSVSDFSAGAAAQLVNGDIAVDSLGGGFSGQITNGSIDCDLLSLEVGEFVLLQTTNGNVTLWLPADVSAVFSASTVTGEITISGFSMIDYTVNEPLVKTGVIGLGGASIAILATNGNISIIARE